MTVPILSVTDLCKTFRSGGGLWRKPRQFHAVSGVSFDVHAGETVGVVGESGSGKSTLARVVLRLMDPSSGSIWFEGEDIAALPEKTLRPLRRRFQMVFQDPYSSINPRLTIREALLEPFRVQGLPLTAAQEQDTVDRLMSMVSLNPVLAESHPHHLSGGQKQRVGIARALALQPSLLVLDEPTASLDVSVQAQVIQLLQALRAQQTLTYLFISHDLALVRYFCDRIMVMYLGRVVEVMPKGAAPAHPYTRALLDSSFEPDPTQRRTIVRITGEIPSGYDLPPGCAFQARCPKAQELCRRVRPDLGAVGTRHQAACHFPDVQTPPSGATSSPQEIPHAV